MRYPAAETAEKHQRALASAARLFRERGFTGASISDIMSATGLTHGSFYNHFDSKEALLAEAFRFASKQSLDRVDEFDRTQGGKRKLYEEYLSASHRDNAGDGCIMAALATDFRDQPQARAVVTSHIKALVERLAERFPWPPSRNRRRLAIRALSTMVGGLILARAADDPKLSDEILREVLGGLRE